MLVAKQRERDTRGAEHLTGARRRGGLNNFPIARGKPRATTVQSPTSSTQTNTDENDGFVLASREDKAIRRISQSTSVVKEMCLKHTSNIRSEYILVHSACTAPEEGTQACTGEYLHTCRTRDQFRPMSPAR